jgi:hypothetical protein
MRAARAQGFEINAGGWNSDFASWQKAAESQKSKKIGGLAFLPGGSSAAPILSIARQNRCRAQFAARPDLGLHPPDVLKLWRPQTPRYGFR